MSRWGCGGKPELGAMRSLFHTRSAPQCTRLGSRYSAKLKWKLALSQPWLDLPSLSKGRSSIMEFTSRRQNGAPRQPIKFLIGNEIGPIGRNTCKAAPLPLQGAGREARCDARTAIQARYHRHRINVGVA